MKIKTAVMTLHFLAVILLPVESLYSHDVELKLVAGAIKTQAGTVPVPEFAKDIDLSLGEDGEIRISFTIFAKSVKAMEKDYQKLQKFYANKSVFGVPVKKMKKTQPPFDRREYCDVEDYGSEVTLTIGPASSSWENTVFIANRCYE